MNDRDFDKITFGCFVSFNDTATTRKGKRYLVNKKTDDEINFMNGGCLHKVFRHHWISMGGYINSSNETGGKK